MIRNSLILAFRNLLRRKTDSAVIILSLAFGFAFANLLVSFLIRELRTDSFHTKKDRLFQVFSDDPFEEGARISFILNKTKQHLTERYPEVEDACQVYGITDNGVLTTGEKRAFPDVMVLGVDSSFFNLFDFPFAQGSPQNPFEPGSILLSKRVAETIFGNRQAIGQTLTLRHQNAEKPLLVTGVLDKFPENSHLKFDALVHYAGFGNQDGGVTYVLTREDSQPAQLQTKINRDAARPGLIGPGKTDYFLEPVQQSYFNSDNKGSFTVTRSGTFIWIGWLVAGSLLFIASFNFINLFLLQFGQRRKEFGVKKVLGISRLDLLQAAGLEVTLYVGVAYGLSLLLTLLLLPEFNAAFESTLPLSYLSRVEVISALGGITLLLAIIVVLFSVGYQSQVQPVSLLQRQTSGKRTFNKGLFTLQFVVATTLAICSVTIIRQMHFIENEPLGFNRNLIQLRAPTEELAAKLPVLKQQLRQNPATARACLSNGNPISGNMMVRYDLPNEQFYSPYLFSGDEDLLKIMGITVLEGTGFSQDHSGKLVNEKLVRRFNLKNPIGQTIPGTEDKIIGVVNDFTCVSLREEIPPVIISFAPDAKNILIDYTGQDVAALLPEIKRQWRAVFPNHDFGYSLIEDDLLRKHKEDVFFYKIITAFSVASIMMAGFGLFALSWGTVQSKTKEIGIRKVLGASASQIVLLLSGDFLRLIVLAFLIAAPIAGYAMHQWLAGFAYRIHLSWWLFAIAGLLALLIALLTMSYQAIRAALANPVESLRSE